MRNNVIMTFGRFQPPHIGHQEIVHKMMELSNGSPFYIFTSHTQDNRINPLSYEDKLYFLDKSFPNATIVRSEEIRTLFQALKFFNGKTKKITFVLGSDRAGDLGIKKLWTNYYKHSDPNKALLFDEFEVVQAGKDRKYWTGKRLIVDPEEVSGELVRMFAIQGNFDKFYQICPALLSNYDVRNLYIKVRNGLLYDAKVSGTGSKSKRKVDQETKDRWLD